MKQIISIILIFSQFFAVSKSWGTLSTADKQYLPIQNYLVNPGFENGFNSWVKYGSGSTTTNTAPHSGAAGLTFTSSANNSGYSQTINWPFSTGGLNGVQVIASCWANLTSGSNSLIVTDGTNVLSTTSLPVNTGTGWKLVQSTPFAGPTTGTATFKVNSNTSGSAYTTDDCMLTNANQVIPVGYVAQSQSVGSLYFVPASSCVWTLTQTTYAADFSANASCNAATVTNDGVATVSSPGKVPQVTITNAPPGNYQVLYTGAMAIGANSNGTCRIIDELSNQLGEAAISTAGQLPFTINGNQTYTTAATHTYKVQCLSLSSTVNLKGDPTDGTNGFVIKYFPTSNQGAVNSNAISQPTVTKLLSGSGTYTVPTGVTRIEVEMVGGGGGGGNASTTYGGGGGGAGGYVDAIINNNSSAWAASFSYAVGASGAATATGGNTTFGTSLLVANGGVGGAGGNQGGVGGTASLGTGPIGKALQGGSGTGSSGSSTTGGGNGAATPFGGAGGGGAQTLTGQTAIANTGSGGGGSGGSGGGGGAGGSGAIYITEYYGQNMPIIIGGVVSNSSGTERVERALITATCSSATCTTTSSAGITSITRSGTGLYAVNFSTAFAAVPSCHMEIAGATAYGFAAPQSSSTSSVFNFVTVTAAATPVPQDVSFASIVCMGPK